MSILFACGNCGKKYKVEDRFAGKKVKCKACETINLIPEPAPSEAEDGGLELQPIDDAPAPRPAPAPAKRTKKTAPVSAPVSAEPDFDLSILEQAAGEADAMTGGGPAPMPGDGAAPAGGANTCPGCGGRLAEGAVFCVGCGYDLRSGRQKATKVFDPEKPQTRLVASESRNENLRGGKSGSSGGGGDTGSAIALRLIIVGGTSGILPLVGLQWRGLNELGTGAFLVGAALAGAGALIYALKSNWGGFAFGVIAAVFAVGVYVASNKLQKPDTQTAEDDSKPGLTEPQTPVAQKVSPPDVMARSGIPSSMIPRNRPPVNPPPSPPAGDSDFMVDGRPKIIIDSARGGSIFTNTLLSYRYERVPPGQDVVQFYRPGLRHSDPRVRVCAIDIILKHAPQEKRAEAVEAISELLGDSATPVRGRAIEAQALVCSATTVGNLIRALDDSEKGIREHAIHVLGLFKDPAAIEALQAHLADDENGVLNALSGYGPEHNEKVAAAFASMLTHSERHIRGAALQEVMKRNPKGCAEQIANMVDDPDFLIRERVVNKLMELKYEPLCDKLVARLGQDPSIPALLTKFGPAAEKAVLAKVGDSDVKVKLAAIHLLGTIGTIQSLEAIRVAAGDEDLAVSTAAREVWKKLDPNAASPMGLAMLDLESSSAPKQARALRALATMKPDKNQEALSKKVFDLMISGADAQVAAAAAGALAVWADNPTRDALVECVKPEGDEEKRRRAIPVLAKLKDARIVPVLVDCVAQNKDPAVVDEALKAYGPAAEDGLVKLLRSDDSAVVVRVIDLLKQVGTRKSLQGLSAIALDARHPAQAQAREAAAAINRRLSGRP